MGESAGALLLRAGVVTPDQLMVAHAARQQQGGTLGYHLVRMGLVEEEKLAEFYRHRLMVPRLRREALERIRLKVIESVPRDMAAEFRVVPADVDREGNLTLAMSDPSDTHAVDEVGFFTGHYVMRAVAAESDIEWALAKYYGVLKPISVAPKTQPAFFPKEDTRPYHASPPLPPPAEEPPILLTQKKPRPVAEPAPVAVPKRKPTKPRVSGEGRAVKAAPVVHRAPQAAAPAPAPASARAAATAQSGQSDRPVMLQLLEVVDHVRTARDRDAVARWMLDFLVTIYVRTAFFVLKKGAIATFDARGRLRSEALRALTIPLDAPSLLHDVIATRTPYRGPLDSSPVNNLVATALGEVPAEIVLVPVRVRERVIGVLYADGPKQSVPDGVLDRLALEAGAAYERILRNAKK